MLRLRHVQPGGLLCFLLFEGVIALAALMALAELVNWWAVPLLPLIVAGLVKINDLVAGVFARADLRRRRSPAKPPRARGVAKVRGIAKVSETAKVRSVPAVVPMAGYPRTPPPSTTPAQHDTIRIAAPAVPGRRDRGKAPNERRFVR
jgi:hypothetical protein